MGLRSQSLQERPKEPRQEILQTVLEQGNMSPAGFLWYDGWVSPFPTALEAAKEYCIAYDRGENYIPAPGVTWARKSGPVTAPLPPKREYSRWELLEID